MEKLFRLIFRLAGEIDAELTEGGGIDLGKNYRGMDLGILKTRYSLERQPCGGVVYG